MKRIKLFAILAFAFCIAEVSMEFSKGFKEGFEREFEKGYESARRETDKKKREVIPQVINVVWEEQSTPYGTVYNNRLQEDVPYRTEDRIVVPVQLPLMASIVIPIIIALSIPLLLVMLYCFVKLMVSVFKKNIFTDSNARLLRVLSYGMLIIMCVYSLIDYLIYKTAAAQTELTGGTIGSYSEWTSFSGVLLLVLLAEIFAFGVKMQEERELTI